MGILIASCLVLASARRLSKLPITYTPRARGGGRIINGVDADVGEFPHQIILKHHGSLMCGGSLVAPDRVITAGHCCDGQSASSLSVTVGEYDRRHDDGTEVDIKVDKVVPNENYSPWELTNDICLLYLAEAAEFNDAVGAIGLPESMQEYDEGTDCTVIGWGTTEQGVFLKSSRRSLFPWCLMRHAMLITTLKVWKWPSCATPLELLMNSLELCPGELDVLSLDTLVSTHRLHTSLIGSIITCNLFLVLHCSIPSE